ncbi:DNA ligase 3 isoform X2 [Lycorma delicatula]
MWLRLLLPGFVKRTYNLQSKQLIKLFSRLFVEDQDEMLEDLEKGDVAETVRVYFEKSTTCIPLKKSSLTVQEVDEFLEYLSKLTREEEQLNHFKKISSKCTSNDLKMIVRLVKHDLRINAGAKHILEAVHPDAYAAFQASRDITSVINRIMNSSSTPGTSSLSKDKSNVSISLLTPVLPMLAEACKSVEQAMKKCPNGFYSEIKYDGERVQVHKQGSEFKYFSRSLKPVLPHKVNHFKDFIPKAFPHGKDLILDSEILMVDLNTGKPLPFGTLGIHKKSEFKDASVCLFVFDCLYYNNESLLHKPLKERKRILRDNMTEIPNHIVFSEMEEISEPKELEQMMTKVFRLGLEGLVLKDVLSPYEPGKRHWLKVKKDYLFDGAMADSADLVVIGAWYGTGQKGGMMSVFLMGCYDHHRKKWCTVTKVHTGHDDKTLERLQTELDMVKISKDQTKVPDWLLCTKTMIPDFVARNPKAQPVWEITGAEFTKHDVHTAAGISVRFPRVTRIRSDKNWETATSLSELKVLFEKSKDNQDFVLLSSTSDNAAGSSQTSPKKRKTVTSSPSPMKKKRVELASPDKKQLTLFDVTVKPSSVSPNVKQIKHPRSEDDNDLDVPPRDIEYGRKRYDKEKDTHENNNSVAAKMKKLKLLKKPLPDVFNDVKLFIPTEENIKDRTLLEQYFIAFGGKLLKSYESDQATHVIKSSKKDLTGVSNCVIVEPDWLWDSIKLKKQQDYTVY